MKLIVWFLLVLFTGAWGAFIDLCNRDSTRSVAIWTFIGSLILIELPLLITAAYFMVEFLHGR